MANQITLDNLDKDRHVLGVKWNSTYGGWFSSEENIRNFIEAVKPVLPKKPLDILYVCSAAGLLGEKLLEDLGQGTLTLVDISQAHLDENKNPHTQKLCMDILEMNLGRKFDLILMRSALDYFPTKALQEKALSQIALHLKPDGIFINQPAYISDEKERELVSAVYNTVPKIGRRLFQSSDMGELYTKVGLAMPQKIGDGNDMHITDKDHRERYKIDDTEIVLIQSIVKNLKTHGHLTEDGYELTFDFPIFESHLG